MTLFSFFTFFTKNVLLITYCIRLLPLPLTKMASATAPATALDNLIQLLENSPYCHPYDEDNRYFLCKVKRTGGAFSFGVVCEPMIRLARDGNWKVHVNVWRVGYQPTADSEWPSDFKMVPFQDFLAWNTPNQDSLAWNTPNQDSLAWNTPNQE